jgi:tRNA(Ile)-lysidine synthase
LGLAVSGGPDSMALLLLASAALPRRVEAATVVHGFRPEGAREADDVALLCRQLGVPHVTLRLDWTPPSANRQSRARTARYAELGRWASKRGLSAVATAHHLDDQTETLLMRLHRGAGVGGLAGIRPDLTMTFSDSPPVRLVRPLLGWRKSELSALATALAVPFTTDPANADPAHDRTGARAFLDASPSWPDRKRVAASAAHLQEADLALDWATLRLLDERRTREGDGWRLAVADLPAELRRRLTLKAIAEATGAVPRGDRLNRALLLLDAGRVATLGGLVIRPAGGAWHLAPAPPRR